MSTAIPPLPHVPSRRARGQLHISYNNSNYICYIRNIYMSAQIPSARSPWRLNFVQWCLTFVDPRHGTCFMTPSWGLEF